MDEQNRHWQDLRIAAHVAREGTLSGAARIMGMHHATVIRRIDALEARIGCKLFQRHARGYLPTAAGKELLRVATGMEKEVSALTARLRGQDDAVRGELIITTLNSFSPWLVPLLGAFMIEYPDLRLSLLLDGRLLRLEHGEAHVALRAGPRPQEPDNVVRRLGVAEIALFAHESYVERYGMPHPDGPFDGHRFLQGTEQAARAPVSAWVRENVPPEQIVFRASETRSLDDAMIAGIGIGFAAVGEQANWRGAGAEPQGFMAGGAVRGLVQLCPPRPEWRTDLWLVSHRDLSRSAKVQALSRFLRAHMATVREISPR